MMRVSMISDYDVFNLNDKTGVLRQIKVANVHGVLYLGPIHAFFDRSHVMKDKHRMNFTSKLDKKQNELMFVTELLNKIEKHSRHSYFTKEFILEFLKEQGYTEENMIYKPKTYTTAKEMFIEYGFNSMNFCLDRRGDIWVHYKAYEEKKQYNEIISHIITKAQKKEFEEMYKKLFRFVRYTNMDDPENIKCFALKSVNITKLYFWLKDHGLIHQVKYVSDIYNETLREIEFHYVSSEDSYIKVTIEDGKFKLKNNYNEDYILTDATI